MREAFAILSGIQADLAPNIREEVRHHENLALLAEVAKPAPLLRIEPVIVQDGGIPLENQDE